MLTWIKMIKLICSTLILSSLLFSTPLSFGAGRCFPSKFSYLSDGKKKEILITACSENRSIVSRDCLGNKCTMAREITNIKYEEFEIGSPHFQACHLIQGFPRIGQYLKKGEWHNASLCFDRTGKSFMEGAAIMKILFR